MALLPNRKGHDAWDKSPESWQGHVTAAQQWSEDTLRLLTLLCNARRGRPNTEPCEGGPAGGAVHLSLPAAGSCAARARDPLRHRPRAQGGLRAVPPAHAGCSAAEPPAGVRVAAEPTQGSDGQPAARRLCGARCGAKAVSTVLPPLLQLFNICSEAERRVRPPHGTNLQLRNQAPAPLLKRSRGLAGETPRPAHNPRQCIQKLTPAAQQGPEELFAWPSQVHRHAAGAGQPAGGFGRSCGGRTGRCDLCRGPSSEEGSQKLCRRPPGFIMRPQQAVCLIKGSAGGCVEGRLKGVA